MKTSLRDVRSPGWSTHPAHPAVALFLHGFGSNEHDLGPLAPALGLNVAWASLRAPLELGNGAAAWFSITTPGNPDAGPVQEAGEAIWAWVEAHVDPETQVVPIGFSQGGLMASQLLRTRPERVVAPVVLGGFVLGHRRPATPLCVPAARDCSGVAARRTRSSPPRQSGAAVSTLPSTPR